MFFYKVLIAPLSFIAMIFIALVFTLPINNRNAKFLIRITLGVSFGFLVYFLEQIFYTMGLSGTLPQLLSVISVPILCLIFSIIYIFSFEEA